MKQGGEELPARPVAHPLEDAEDGSVRWPPEGGVGHCDLVLELRLEKVRPVHRGGRCRQRFVVVDEWARPTEADGSEQSGRVADLESKIGHAATLRGEVRLQTPLLAEAGHALSIRQEVDVSLGVRGFGLDARQNHAGVIVVILDLDTGALTESVGNLLSRVGGAVQFQRSSDSAATRWGRGARSTRFEQKPDRRKTEAGGQSVEDQLPPRH